MLDLQQKTTGSLPGFWALHRTPTGGFTASSLITSVSAGTWYEAVLDMHYLDQVFDITVTNLDNPSESVTRTNLRFRFDNTAVSGIRFARPAGAEFQNASFDDILMFVPEPGTAALLLIGGMLIANRRRW